MSLHPHPDIERYEGEERFATNARMQTLPNEEPAGVLALFGGTGATGRVLTACALTRGLHIKALARPGSSLRDTDPRICRITGELWNRSDVGATIAESSAVCCVFGPRPPFRDVFCAEATRRILAAMSESGVRRIVCQTGAMIGDWHANRTWAMGLMAAAFAKRFPEVARDRAEQERLIIESDRDWCIIKPPRLTDGPPRKLIAGPHVRVGLLSSVSRRSVAELIIELILDSRLSPGTLFLR